MKLQMLAPVVHVWRWRSVRWSILFLPSILAAVYFFFVASDQFESEAKFVVRTAARPEVSGGLALLTQLGFGRSQDDSFIVQEFMISRDAIAELQTRLPLGAMFSRDDVDFLARYPSLLYGPEAEEFYRYFQRVVSIAHTAKSDISTLRVRAFSAPDARDIAEILLVLGENLVNRINQRLLRDAIGNSQADLTAAQRRVVDAQASLTEFRNQEMLLDPVRNAAALGQLIAQLSSELASTQAQITEMRSASASSPQMAALQRKAMALEEQIVRERMRIAGDNTGLAARIASYERLVLEREFANKMLLSAEANLARSKTEAGRQLLYLERIVQPSLADRATQPKRLRNVLSVFGANVLLVLIGWLILSGVREHAGSQS